MSSKSKVARPSGADRDYGGSAAGFFTTGPSYDDCDAEELKACIEAVTAVGDAVLFARTSDGGALSVRVLSQGRTFPHYVVDTVTLNGLLTSLRRAAGGD